MEGAVMTNVPGIVAECGGGCSCGTCHVFLDAAWMEAVTPAGKMEDSVLDFVDEVAPNSRLSCQIPSHDGLDGLVVRLPQKQGC
jgi:2Fe-2S ferredoxin